MGKYFLIACLLKYTAILNICIRRQVLILTHPCYGFVTILSLFGIFMQGPLATDYADFFTTKTLRHEGVFGH